MTKINKKSVKLSTDLVINDCPCGSDKLYKDCCAGKNNFVLKEVRISIDSFRPVIKGLDNMPDLKASLVSGLTKFIFNEDSDMEDVVNETIRKYNKLMVTVDRKLPEPYGVMIQKAKHMLHKKQYEKAIEKADVMLAAYPESISAKEIKDNALFAIQKHPVQILFARIVNSSGKDRAKLLKELHETTLHAGQFLRIEIFHMVKDLYDRSEPWEGRYAALDILKNILFYDMEWKYLNSIYKFVTKALCDDDGRVRKNAFYCISNLRILIPQAELFFMLYDKAGQERGRKQHNVCRALLELVAPSTDDEMYHAGFYKDYRKAIEFALKVTNYDQTYFLADPAEKIKMNIFDRKRKLLK